jgi:hypothetical protein
MKIVKRDKTLNTKVDMTFSTFVACPMLLCLHQPTSLTSSFGFQDWEVHGIDNTNCWKTLNGIQPGTNWWFNWNHPICSDRKAISNKTIHNSSLKYQVTCDIRKVFIELMIPRTCKRIYNGTFNNPIKECNILSLVFLSNEIWKL